MRFALPTKKQVITWALRVLGVLILGALGNGVWQSLLGPAIHISTTWVLDIASLGLTSYKNEVYKRIATDNQYAVGFSAYLMLWTVHAVVITSLIAYGFYSVSSSRYRLTHILRRLSDAPPDPKPEISRDDALSELRDLSKSVGRQRLLLYCWLLIAGVDIVNEAISLVRLSYVNSADAHYHQVLRVAAPYLDARELAEVESDFAQVSSREDYVRVLLRLESECKGHSRTVPKFDPW